MPVRFSEYLVVLLIFSITYSSSIVFAAPGVVRIKAQARLLHCEKIIGEDVGIYPQQSIWRGSRTPPENLRIGLLQILENPYHVFSSSISESEKSKYKTPIRWTVGYSFVALIEVPMGSICDADLPRLVKISTYFREEQASAVLGLASVIVEPD